MNFLLVTFSLFSIAMHNLDIFTRLEWKKGKEQTLYYSICIDLMHDWLLKWLWWWFFHIVAGTVVAVISIVNLKLCSLSWIRLSIQKTSVVFMATSIHDQQSLFSNIKLSFMTTKRKTNFPSTSSCVSHVWWKKLCFRKLKNFVFLVRSN